MKEALKTYGIGLGLVLYVVYLLICLAVPAAIVLACLHYAGIL